MVAGLERQRQELASYDGDRKIGEVYEKMHDSVRRISTESSEPSLPFKRSFENKHRDLLGRYEANPEEELQGVSRLPPLSRPNNWQESESERNWREWFAKEKLRELESYYRKLATLDPPSSTLPDLHC